MRGFRCVFERGKADFVAIMGLIIVKNLTQLQPKKHERIKYQSSLDNFFIFASQKHTE